MPNLIYWSQEQNFWYKKNDFLILEIEILVPFYMTRQDNSFYRKEQNNKKNNHVLTNTETKTRTHYDVITHYAELQENRPTYTIS